MKVFILFVRLAPNTSQAQQPPAQTFVEWENRVEKGIARFSFSISRMVKNIFKIV
jgi:hypothetical protein